MTNERLDSTFSTTLRRLISAREDNRNREAEDREQLARALAENTLRRILAPGTTEAMARAHRVASLNDTDLSNVSIRDINVAAGFDVSPRAQFGFRRGDVPVFLDCFVGTFRDLQTRATVLEHEGKAGPDVPENTTDDALAAMTAA